MIDQAVASLEPDIVTRNTKIRSACMVGADRGLGIDDIVVQIKRTYKIRVERKVVKQVLWEMYGL